MSTESIQNQRTVITQFLGVVLAIVLINIILSFFNLRVDLTEDRRFSLSENTKTLLKDDGPLKDRVFFKIYLEGDLPADMKNIRNNIQYILDEFIAYAGDKIQYEFINPTASSDQTISRSLQEKLFNKGDGILPTRINSFEANSQEQLLVWPGAVVEYGGETVDVIQFFNREVIVLGENLQLLVDNTINNLEFKIISCIRRITNDNRLSIGFLQGHGELNENQTLEVRKALKKNYRVGDIEIEGQINALEDIDALVIAKPLTRFTEKEKFIIDQFVMHGGKVLWSLDPIDVNSDSLAYTGETMGIGRDLNIDDLLYKYGVRLNKDIILDEDCTHEYIQPNHTSNPGLPWVFYPLIQTSSHSIVNNLDPIKLEYSSSLDLVNLGDKSIKKTILLTSSIASKSLMAPVRINYSFAFEQYQPDFSNPKLGNRPMAILLEGQFKSSFENRINKSFLESPDYKTKFNSNNNKMIVVSDGDLINGSYIKFNRGRKKMFPVALGFDRFDVRTKNGSPKFYYGNKDFFLNSIDYLLGDSSLLSIRSKTITLRMLDEDKINNDKSFWKILNIIFPIGTIIILAIVLLLIRKRKYAK